MIFRRRCACMRGCSSSAMEKLALFSIARRAKFQVRRHNASYLASLGPARPASARGPNQPRRASGALPAALGQATAGMQAVAQCLARGPFSQPPKTVWPSGLRRWLKAPVRKGVGSNPTAVILHVAHDGAGPNQACLQRSMVAGPTLLSQAGPSLILPGSCRGSPVSSHATTRAGTRCCVQHLWAQRRAQRCTRHLPEAGGSQERRLGAPARPRVAPQKTYTSHA